MTLTTEALRVDPESVVANNYLGKAHRLIGAIDDAAKYYREALRIDPGYVAAHVNLAGVLELLGETDDAIEHYRLAIHLQPDWPTPYNNLAWILATHPDATIRNGQEAVRLAESVRRKVGDSNPNVLDTMAAAYAEASNFDKAVITAEKAIEAADQAKSALLRKRIEERLKLYRGRRPFRSTN